ncbi:MAG: response regulator [Bacteroidia bacterium]
MITDKICFLIDDDEDDQEIFKMALKELKCNVSCVSAYSGTEAIRKLEDGTFTPHYIFLDLNMPRMNGKQCLAEIKKMKHLDHVPVFIYSTSSDSQIIKETLQLGASDYIIKPPSVSSLTGELLKHLGLRGETGT